MAFIRLPHYSLSFLNDISREPDFSQNNHGKVASGMLGTIHFPVQTQSRHSWLPTSHLILVQGSSWGFPNANNIPEQRDQTQVVLSRSRQFGKCPPVSSCLVSTKTRLGTQTFTLKFDPRGLVQHPIFKIGGSIVNIQQNWSRCYLVHKWCYVTCSPGTFAPRVCSFPRPFVWGVGVRKHPHEGNKDWGTSALVEGIRYFH